MTLDVLMPIAIPILIVLVWLFNCLNILREYERAVVFRLGRVLKKEKGPGLVLSSSGRSIRSSRSRCVS